MAIWTSQWPGAGGGGGGGATTASAVSFNPTAGISATNVQAALAELDIEKLSYARGTVAARPASFPVNTLYVVNGDPTPANNGLASVYDTGLATWIPLAGGSGGSIATGTLASRPASPTSNSIYVVSGDTAVNNGRTYFYNSSTTTWFEVIPPTLLAGTLASRPANPGINAVYVVTGDSVVNNGRAFLFQSSTSTWIEINPPSILSGTLAARPATPTVNTLYVVNGDATATNNQRLFFYRTATSTWTELNYVQKDGDTMSGTLVLEPTTGSAIQVKDFGTGDVVFEIDPLMVHGVFYSPGAYASPGSGEITELSGGVVNVASGATNPTNPNYTTVTTPGFITVDNGSGVPPMPTLAGHLTNKKYVDDLTSSIKASGFPLDPATGYVDRTSSLISFDDATSTFDIVSASGLGFNFYVEGVIYTRVSDSITIPNVSGVHHIYFDTAGNIQSTTTFIDDIITRFCYVASVYWNATAGSHTFLGDERHGVTMDAHTHINLHKTRGALLTGDGALTNITPDQAGSVASDAQFGVAGGVLWDEDLNHNISAVASTNPIPVFYRAGTEWYEDLGTTYSFRNQPSGRVQYNQLALGNYSVAEVSNNNCVLYHIIATNDPNRPLVSLMGLDQYTNRNLARRAALTEIKGFSGLPFHEFSFLGTIIIQTSNTYTNSGKARIVSTASGDAYVDWRGMHYTALLAGLASEEYVDSKAYILNDLEDVDVVTTTPVNSHSIFYNTVTQLWENRPGVRTVNFSSPDLNGNISAAFTKVTTGTLAARPAVGTPGLIEAELYIVSADTAANNGRTFIYDADSIPPAWREINNTGGAGVSLFKVCSPFGSNVTGSGTFNSPYQTIAHAIQEAGSTGVVVCLPGTYNEVVNLTAQLNIVVVGLSSAVDSHGVSINGGFILSGTTTRVRLRDLSITGTVANPTPLVDNNSQGRNYYYNVYFGSQAGVAGTAVSFNTPNRWHEFTDCNFLGEFNTGANTGVNSAVIRLYRPRNLINLNILNNVPAGVLVSDADTLGVTAHLGSPLLISNVRSVVNFNCDCDTPNGLLYIDNASFYVAATNSYTTLTKTGTCGYRITDTTIDRANPALQGFELDTTNTHNFLRLREVEDVDLITTAPTNRQVLMYDAPNTKWIPGDASGAFTGTLAARPASYPSNTLYIVDGDATAANNGRTFIYDTVAAAWIELDTKITNRGITDLNDVDTTTTPPTLTQALTWDGTNWVPGNTSGAFTGTLAARPASYTANTLYVVSGDATAENNGRTFLYNVATTTWIELDTKITNRKLDDLIDVDLTTIPPTNRNILQYDSTASLWKPVANNAVNYTYSAIAPAFATINPGHIWIESTTMNQYIFVDDDAGNDVWISLGNANTAKQFTVQDAVLFPNPVIYENIDNAWQDLTAGIPTVDFKMRAFGSVGGLNYNVGTFSGKKVANIGVNNTAGNGVAIKVPAGYNTVWFQFFTSTAVTRETRLQWLWKSSAWSTTSFVQGTTQFNNTVNAPQNWNTFSPYGRGVKQTHFRDFSWRMCTLPDSGGGILYVNNIGTSTGGGFVTGMAYTKNPYNITQAGAFDIYTNLTNGMINTNPAHPVLALPDLVFGDWFQRINTNVSKRMAIPFVRNGKDKMIVIESYDNYWNMSIPWDGFYVNGTKIPETNIRANNDFIAAGMTLRDLNSNKNNFTYIRVPRTYIEANSVSPNWFEFTISTLGANDAWFSYSYIHTYDIPFNSDNQF